MGKQQTIYFIRHGQTYLNSFNRIQGWADSPLTPKGINDGISMGQRLKSEYFDNIYASDTMRAGKTAEMIINENKNDLPDVIVLPELREQFYGYFEGMDASLLASSLGQGYQTKTLVELAEKVGLDGLKDLIHHYDPSHQAEDARMFWNRIDQAFKIIQDQNADNAKILVVAHGTIIKSLVDKYDVNNIFKVKNVPANGSLTEFVVTGNERKVIRYNEL